MYPNQRKSYANFHWDKGAPKFEVKGFSQNKYSQYWKSQIEHCFTKILNGENIDKVIE
jgi:hypothetical protein